MKFSNLGDELLVHVLSFTAPRDVESLTVASSVIARDVLPRFPTIWKNIFRQRWESLNFPLDGVAEGDALLEINENLDMLFPSSCTESRRFQLLAHAIIPMPSYADIRQTKKALGYTDAYHRTIPVQAPDLMERHTVDFALDGEMLGDDRCVRANMPFPAALHVVVYKCNPTDGNTAKGAIRPVFQVGVVLGGYFELSLSKRQHRHEISPSMFGQESMTSIGLVNSRFPLVGKQPGWTRTSYGYHGDDGRFYHGTAFEGRPFGPRFKAGCTVGCGIRIDPITGTMLVFFTNDGKLIAGDDGAFMACEHRDWYPAVGLDSYDALHLNFGQKPFVFSDVTGTHRHLLCQAGIGCGTVVQRLTHFVQCVDWILLGKLFSECNGMGHAILNQLQWNDIRDFDGEDSEDEEDHEKDESGDEVMSDEQISVNLIVRILAMRRAERAVV